MRKAHHEEGVSDVGTYSTRNCRTQKLGTKPQAAHLLRLAIQDDPKDIQAWLWLSGAINTGEERIKSLQAALKIDPNNRV